MLRLSRELLAATAAFGFGRRGASAIPHPAKAHRGGEDAFFADWQGIGVADGVGGCASMGINPALYTRDVMQGTLEAVKKAASGGGILAVEALNEGAHWAHRRGEQGSCAVTVVTMVQDGQKASILNLGDCGVLVVRDSKLLFQTEAQQHYFNCPFQLPSDSPSSGDSTELQLRDGDIFLCASDGVLDNVDIDALLKVMKTVNAGGCQQAADRVAGIAVTNAANKKFMSPFAKHAAEAGYKYIGGKVDDVTVVVAQVSKEASQDSNDICPPLITDYFAKMQ